MLSHAVKPLHIVFAIIAIILSVVALLVNHPNINNGFLLTINVLLWALSVVSIYLFMKSLQTKRAQNSLTAINGGVMLKLFALAVFIPLYHVVIAKLPIASLLLAAALYIIYTAIHIRVMLAINNANK
jgi:hypothetical protein